MSNQLKCPKCSRTIPLNSRKCSCGYEISEEAFDRLNMLTELKKDFASLSRIKEEFHIGLEKISYHIEKYEATIFENPEETTSPDDLGLMEEKQENTSVLPTSGEKKEPSLSDSKLEETKPVLQQKEKKTKDNSFEIHLGQKVLLATGIIIMIFSIGFFLKYSIEHNWVSPLARTLIAYAWGAGFIIGGEVLRRKNFRTFGLAIGGGGIATLYAATFAAFQLYKLMSQPVAFLLMIVVTVLGCFLSVIYNTRGLIVLSTLGGFLTPALLSTGSNHQVALMSYMVILNMGILAVAFYKRWSILNSIGFIATYILFSAWFFDNYSLSCFWTTLLFLNIFYLIYAIAPFAFFIFKKTAQKAGGLWIVFFNAFIVFVYSSYLIANKFSIKYTAIASISYASVSLIMAFIIYKRGNSSSGAVTALSGTAIMFLIVTVPILFSQYWITVFWASEAVVLVVMSRKLNKTLLAVGANTLLAVSAYKLLFYDYYGIFHFSWSSGAVAKGFSYLLVPRYITIIIVLAIIYTFGVLRKQANINKPSELEKKKNSGTFHFAIFGTFLFIFLNTELSAFFHDHVSSARFAAISVLWALFAIGTMVLGFRKNISILRKTAISLFLFTVIKVFFYDISKISSIYRILSFFILSIVLIGTSYLYWAFKDKIIQAVAGEKEKS